MCHWNTESPPPPEHIRVCSLRPLHPLFYLRVATSQHHQLQIAVCQVVHSVSDQIRALLEVQPSDESNQWLVGLHRESELLLQLRLTLGFARHALLTPREVVEGNVRISGRVPFINVYTVGDSIQNVSSTSQEPFQPEPSLRSRDLICVPLAHRDNAISGDDCSLEGIDRLSFVEFVGSHVLWVYPFNGSIPVIRKAQSWEDARWLCAMMHHIVNGKDRTSVLVDTMGSVL
mmetsp:Transcript_1826/g.2014  ORF Transcript_1826/g.2014 Transcript_1826/m.2014 type:complete len:231 (-) Transcript_1826:1223-1915(-)